MFLLGLAIFLFGVVGFMVLLGGNLNHLILSLDLLFTTFFALLAVVTATRSIKLFYHGLRAVVFPKSDISAETSIRAAALFKLLSKTTGAATAINIIICFINIFMTVDLGDPKILSYMLVNFAGLFVTALHGIILIFAVFEPIVFILKKRCGNELDL